MEKTITFEAVRITTENGKKNHQQGSQSSEIYIKPPLDISKRSKKIMDRDTKKK